MEIHIGNEIKAVFDNTGMTIAEFGRRISTSRENVYNIFERQTIDTGLLLNISAVLEYDFFSLYVNMLDFTQAEIDRLKNELSNLKEINELLRNAKK